jgi:polysaccharide export outer membrane protein
MKNNKLHLFFISITLVVLTTSCVTTKHVRYLQDMPIEGMPINEHLEATVAPYDELRINVMSNTGKDDELVRPFNSMQNVGAGYGGGSYYYGYLVDGEGYIEFPVLGKIHVAGLTRLQVQDTIAAQLTRNGHLKDPLVVARFLNFRVFFLTSSGGKVLNITNERCTFLEALAMAGGLDWYTRRDRIGVMREVDGKRVIHYLDPRSTSIFDDEFFLMQQNDIIFTEERPYKFFTTNLATVMSMVSTALSIYAIYEMIVSKIQ